ncbi:hypothetical protein OIU84_005861, partial [Salix udensis]
MCNIKIIFCKWSNVKLAIVLRGIYDICYTIIILENCHIPAVKSMGPFAVEVAEWTSRIIANGNANSSFGVVPIINMHPHYILSCFLIVNHFWPLKHIGFMEVTGFICLFSFQHDAFIFPCPEVLGGIATNSYNI